MEAGGASEGGDDDEDDADDEDAMHGLRLARRRGADAPM